MKTFTERLLWAMNRRTPAVSQSELARAIGVSPQTIQYLCDPARNAQGSKHTTKIADYLGVYALWLSEGKGSRGPFDETNRVEESASVPYQANTTEGPAIRGRVPIISWVQAGDFCEAIDEFHPGDAEDWAPFAAAHSDMTYALRVRGPSMEPRFSEGEVIIVDPQKQPDNGRFVIAKKSGSHEATFKQLVLEGGESYLRALNPDWPEPIIRLTEDWHICGVVIAKMELF